MDRGPTAISYILLVCNGLRVCSSHYFFPVPLSCFLCPVFQSGRRTPVITTSSTGSGSAQSKIQFPSQRLTVLVVMNQLM
jgi:hypothetical protein